MRKQSLSYHKSHSAAFAQIKMDIPTQIWQTCRTCQQSFNTNSQKFVNNECESCTAKRERQQ